MAKPTTKAHTPTLWIEYLPSEVQHRIAEYVSNGKSCLDALNLAKASPYSRRAVCVALHHTLKETFATHADGLVNDWVDVFEDVQILQLHEHPQNFRLLSSPSLRIVMLEDEPFQLEALANSRVNLESLELMIRYYTPAYLVCRFLAEVTFKKFHILGGYKNFFHNLDPTDFVTACQGVDTIIFGGLIPTGIQHFLTGLSSLRELEMGTLEFHSLSKMLPVMKKLERIRIAEYTSHICPLIRFMTETRTDLKELYLLTAWGEDLVVAFGEVVQQLSQLDKLAVPLIFGAERFFPRIPSLTYLEITWRVDLDTFVGEDEYVNYKPSEGTIITMIERLPCLTSLRLYRLSLSEAEVVSIIERLGPGLKKFGVSIHEQDVAPHQRLLTVVKSLTTHARHLTQLALRWRYHNTALYRSDMLTWSVKQEMLLCIDRLLIRFPELDLEWVEKLVDLVMQWPYEDESEDIEEEDERQKILALRRCRRGLNEKGGASHRAALAKLLETGCDGLEQDKNRAIELYKQAVWRGDDGDAIMKLWLLTEKENPESSEPTPGGALELILEMDKRKLKTLPYFGDLFLEGSGSTGSIDYAAERILQLAVDNGYITHCGMKLANLVEAGYDDVPPDPCRAVSLYRCLVDQYDDTDVLARLASWINRGYGDEPPNPAEARIYLERGVKRRCCQCMTLLGTILYVGYEGVQPDREAAKDLFQQAIDNGSQLGMVYLGVLFAKGHPADLDKAAELFEKGIVDDRHPVGVRLLGEIIEKGYGEHAPDPRHAEELYEEAIEGGDIWACILLANLVANGYGYVLPNPDKAVGLYERVIDGCHKDLQAGALRSYGEFLLQGAGDLKPDPTRAVEYFRKAIDQGDCQALRALGDVLRSGCGDVPPDPTEACKLYQQAIDQKSDSIAMRKLASLMKRGYGDVKPDPVLAVDLYRRAIEGGSVSSCSSLARMFQKGYEGVPQDLGQAAELYKKGVDLGDPDAMWRLGEMLEEGYCTSNTDEGSEVSPDPAEASKLYQRAIDEKSDSTALRKLASLVKRGYDDVEPNPARAVELYNLSIDAGSVTACSSLARMFQMGYDGVPQDSEAAAELYKKGVDLDDPEAMCRLGEMLEEGFCSTYPDPLGAIELYRRAIDEHHYGKAMRYLAETLEEGFLDIPPAPEAAMVLYERGATTGEKWSKFCIARLIEAGYADIEPDIEKAQHLYTEIISEDYDDEVISEAMYCLGCIFEKQGDDDASNIVMAAEWYRKSIEKTEFVMSLFKLAVVTRKGFEGTPPDVSEAVTLLRKAVEYESHAEPFFELADIVRNGYDTVEPDVNEAERLEEEGNILLLASLELQ